MRVSYLVNEEEGAGFDATNVEEPRRVAVLPHLLLAHVHDGDGVPLHGRGRHGVLQQPRRAQRGDHGAQALARLGQDHVEALGGVRVERLQEPLLLERQELVQMLDLPALEEKLHQRVVRRRRPITTRHDLLERNRFALQLRRSWQPVTVRHRSAARLRDAISESRWVWLAFH